jgi:ABC-2 type transport system permease protein
LGFLAALYLSLIIASLRVGLETFLRTSFAPARLKNLQALFTIAGIMAFFFLIANVGQTAFSHAFFQRTPRLPDYVAYLPFTLPGRLCLPFAPRLPLAFAMVTFGVGIPALTAALCAWRVRAGLVIVTGAYVGRRQTLHRAGPPRLEPGGIVGKDVRLLLRDRNFLVQTLVVPAMIVAFQLVLNAGILDAVRTNFQHAAVLAFSIGGYVLVATALTVLSVEGNSVWLLYTLPRSIHAILLEKTALWGGVALLYCVAVLGVCAAVNPDLHASDAMLALLAMIGVGTYAFIAAGIGILGTDPLDPEVRRRVRPETVQLYLLLAAMFAHALYATSDWTRIVQVILSMLLAFALWQKVRDRAPYLLDPVAAPPAMVSVADGLIAALAFFVLQGLCAMVLGVAKIPLGATAVIAFVVAGAIVVVVTLVVFWRAKVRGLFASVGLLREPGSGGLGLTGACLLGASAGLAAAAFAAGYARVVNAIPLLEELEDQSGDLPVQMGIWLPVLAVAVAPIFEEFIFRGLVFRGLRRSTNTTLAILGSAAVFAIVHPPVSVLPVFVLGLAAAWSFERSKLLVSAILAHAVYNAVVVAMGWSSL